MEIQKIHRVETKGYQSVVLWSKVAEHGAIQLCAVIMKEALYPLMRRFLQNKTSISNFEPYLSRKGVAISRVSLLKRPSQSFRLEVKRTLGRNPSSLFQEDIAALPCKDTSFRLHCITCNNISPSSCICTSSAKCSICPLSQPRSVSSVVCIMFVIVSQSHRPLVQKEQAMSSWSFLGMSLLFTSHQKSVERITSGLLFDR